MCRLNPLCNCSASGNAKNAKIPLHEAPPTDGAPDPDKAPQPDNGYPGRSCRQAAAGRGADWPGQGGSRGGAGDRGDGGDLLPLAIGVWEPEAGPEEAAEGSGDGERAPAA